MKKYLFIIALCTFSFSVRAQNGVPDTLAYLQQIVANKAQYIGQPFSVLQNVLAISIKNFTPSASSGGHNRIMEESASFSFLPITNTDDGYLAYPCLNIFWQVPYKNISSSMQLWNANGIGNLGLFSPAVSSHYSNYIIREIYVYQ